MPITKSAIKKMRKDKKRTENRKKKLIALKASIQVVKKTKRKEDLKKTISLIDKAAKTNLIHKNKAARLKSSLSKLVKK